MANFDIFDTENGSILREIATWFFIATSNAKAGSFIVTDDNPFFIKIYLHGSGGFVVFVDNGVGDELLQSGTWIVPNDPMLANIIRIRFLN